MNGCCPMPQTTAVKLFSSILRLVHKIDCVTSTTTVSKPLLGARNMFVEKTGATRV